MSELDLFPSETGQGSDDLEAFWRHFSGDEEPTNRERMILLTMREVALVGPASFNTSVVCDTLGISYPMVNYYFGNRDGLVAEAAHVTYKRYVEKLWAGVQAAPSTPLDRLRAWMASHLRLNVEIRGWGAVLNYPRFSTTIEALLEERFGDEHRLYFELNMGRLARLIADVRDDRVTEFPYGVGELPRDEVLADPDVVRLTTVISWGTLGVAVWRSGRHLPSKGVPELAALSQSLIDGHFDTLVDLVRTTFGR
jgi:AcrR family transcriptional regulator